MDSIDIKLDGGKVSSFLAHLNGYNNGNAVSATANGSAQMSIGQMQQQPVRVQNGTPSQHHLNGTHMNGHMNGHHPPQQQQVPLRTPVPPAPAPITPPPALNGSGPVAKVGNAPPAPPPPPPNICKINSGDKPLTMAEQLQQKQLRKTEQNGSADTNGAVNGTNGAQRPKPKGGVTMDLMSELNKKLLKRQNQEEIVSVTSTTSTGSTSSTEIAEKKDPPPVQKTWTKPASNPNIVQNGHMNGGMDSPKVPKKQFSVSNATLQSAEDPTTIMCTKADLDKLRAELLNEISTMKQQIMEAITKGQ
ncbi:hypothetical protein M3Y97_01118100 [Aphelenchoides bicaudatus]|nr:hypothetical protein M3Y97_01118100 [Aphelenchoides bicaudatus]